MSPVRIAIIYYSTYGTNHQMAEVAAAEAKEYGAEVRLRRVRETAPPEVVEGQEGWKAHAARTAHIQEATPEDIQWADAILFSSPSRFGVVASQMRAFIDTLGPLWQTGGLADKPMSAMTSAGGLHGGQEMTLLSFYVTFMHWGAILVPPGYTDPVIFASGGNPYGLSVTVNGKPLSEEEKASIRHQTRRLLNFAERLNNGSKAAALEDEAVSA